MKVCFIGVGSIARRHIRNLVDIFCNKTDCLEIDALRHHDSAYCDELKYLSKIYNSYAELPNDYDVIFITNPTEYHAETLLTLQNKGKHFFIEKPVVSLNTEHILDGFTAKDDSIYYVACPLRFHKVIQYIRDNLVLEDVLSVRAICSSYLPDWRPDTDYRKTYSAKASLGGGVSIDLIHEWDYLSYLFGFPSSVQMFMGKVSELDIDCEDYSIYIAKYKSMVAELHLDYFGRVPVRKIEIFTKYETIVGDLIKGAVSFLGSGKSIALNEERDSFQKRELKYFLSLLDNKNIAYNDISHAIKVLNLSQGKV